MSNNSLAECPHLEPSIMERLESYGKLINGKSAVVTWGWNIFDLPTNKELAKFFGSRNHDELQEFEEKVFMNGHDPKTYIRIQMMKESKATVELSKEILDKNTEFYPVINCGGVKGYCDGQASSSSGFRNGHHPTMDNPELEHQICEEYYRQMLRNELKQLEKLNKIKAQHDLMRK